MCDYEFTIWYFGRSHKHMTFIYVRKKIEKTHLIPNSHNHTHKRYMKFMNSAKKKNSFMLQAKNNQQFPFQFHFYQRKKK